MRKFYLLYPICQTVSDKLTWSHICELITIEDPLEREFYENECISEKYDKGQSPVTFNRSRRTIREDVIMDKFEEILRKDLHQYLLTSSDVLQN